MKAIVCMMIGGLLAGAWPCTHAVAQVDDSESVWRVLPWDGRIALDGAFVSGTIELRFEVLDSSSNVVWTEEWSSQETRSCSGLVEGCAVAVDDGYFSVALGSHEAFGDVFESTDDRSLRLWARESDGDWTQLGTETEITPTLYAMWTAAAEDSDASAGYVEVDGSAVSRGIASFATLVASVGTGGGGTLSTTSVSAASLDVDSDAVFDTTAVLGSNLTVRGGVDVRGGRVTLAGGAAGDGGILFQDRGLSSGAQYIGSGFNSITITGNVTTSAEFNTGTLVPQSGISADAWMLPYNAAPFAVQQLSLGSSSSGSSSISAANYFCWVGGVRMTSGDICEFEVEDCNSAYNGIDCPGGSDNECDSDRGRCISNDCYYGHASTAHLYPSASNWGANVDFSGTHGAADVTLVCARVSLGGLICSDGTGYADSECTSEVRGGSTVGWTTNTYFFGVGTWPSGWPGAFGP